MNMDIDYTKTFNKLLKLDKVDFKIAGSGLSNLLFTIGETIPVYLDTQAVQDHGGMIACIGINNETHKPFILVDMTFTSLSTRAKVFVLYHEIGHYQNGDFFSKPKTKKSIFRKISERNKYPEKEVLADYYAADKMESSSDAIASINEINSLLTALFHKNKNNKKKAIKRALKSFNKRLVGIEEMILYGPYYIDEGPKEYNAVELEIRPANKLSVVKEDTSLQEAMFLRL